MANTSIRRTFSGNGNTKKWTLSWWEKKNKLGTVQRIFSCDEQGNNNHDDFFQWQTDDKLVMGFYDSGYYANLTPDRKFTDTTGWYHFVFTWDTAQATASNRVKFYVNGVQETVFATETYPSQNKDSFFNTTEPIEIGKRSDNDTQYLESTLSHVHFCDGYAYAASDFGSTDATTGEWKINTSPSVSYGTNGFFIFKNGNGLTDQSPNSNDWSLVSGTLTKSEDCPSNTFASLNPLANCNTSGVSLSNGNNTITTPSGGHDFSVSSLGMFSGNGKFYCEIKISSGTNFNIVGISDHIYQGSNQEISEDNYSYGYYSDSGGSSTGGVVRGNGSNVLTGMPNYTTNDIIGIAVDLENHKLYFSKNGTWINSGDPTSGSTGTGAVAINNLNTTPNTDARAQGAYFFGCGDWYTSGGGTYQCNFGNGYFGTTAVASAGTNASNNGIFEYDVPTGYTALSTKGLNL